MTDLSRWSSEGVWVVEERPEQPEEPQPLFQCDKPANAAQVARIHNEMCDQIEALGSLLDEAQRIAAHWSDDRNHWYQVATTAKDHLDAAQGEAERLRGRPFLTDHWVDVSIADRLANQVERSTADLAAVLERLDRAEEYAREMERQRNAFGEALARAANGENAAEMASEAMLALGGGS